MPTTSTPSNEIEQRANALDGEAIAIRLATFIMTGQHPDLNA